MSLPQNIVSIPLHIMILPLGIMSIPTDKYTDILALRTVSLPLHVPTNSLPEVL